MCPGKGDERVGPEVQGTVPRKLIRSFVLAQQHLLSETLSESNLPGRQRQERGGGFRRRMSPVNHALLNLPRQKANEAPGCREAPATLGK